MANDTKELQVSPADIARALEGIADWARALRTVVLQWDQTATVTVAVAPDAPAKPPLGDGCPTPE